MSDRSRYTAFFILLLFLCVYYWLAVESSWRWWLLWPALSCTVQALAYGLNRPYLVCGKTSSGRISLPMVLLNLPWLTFTWTTWGLIVLFSREPSINPIPGTNVSISRYPLFGVDLAGFDRVLDLTAEFPCLYRVQKQYRCLPSLDGIALSNLLAVLDIKPAEKVLIHCAQGHGRSATFASLLLTGYSIFSTAEGAYVAILNVRPGAKLAKSQKLQLQAGSLTHRT
ncbi:MAG: hypothetical protein ABWY06_12735 [Pseudomonas sp.]|uniref:hypothetical protein n=1 Tax=Pseudomonas sp. TaxID=306 RepID=UPI003399DD57